LLPGQPYFLVGHSDGGSIALLHAAEQPAGLRGIVTEAAHVFVEDVTLAGIEAANVAFAAGKLHGLAKYHGDKTEGIFKAWADTWLSSVFRHWNIEYLLPSIACPALVLQGIDDLIRHTGAGAEHRVKSLAGASGDGGAVRSRAAPRAKRGRVTAHAHLSGEPDARPRSGD
jgi:pimeloyl-ACP methyl ester carboxylesterase